MAPAHGLVARRTGSLRALDTSLRRKAGRRALTADEEIAADGDGLIAIAIALTNGHIALTRVYPCCWFFL
jgi:hypothetical protein